MIVPTPWPSAIVALADGFDEVDEERLVGLVERVADDRDGERLGGLAGGEGHACPFVAV